MKKSVLLISHGSRSSLAKKEVIQLIRLLKKKTKVSIFEYAFLEINRPSIPEGIKNCINKGATEITVLFNFLNSGNHVLKDIPNIVAQSKKEFPHVQFRLTIPIGQYAKIPALFTDILKETKPL